MKKEIAACERIPSFLIKIQPSAAGYKKFITVMELVIYALKIIFPVLVFMYFVKDYQRS
jgi:hypothetical protein